MGLMAETDSHWAAGAGAAGQRLSGLSRLTERVERPATDWGAADYCIAEVRDSEEIWREESQETKSWRPRATGQATEQARAKRVTEWSDWTTEAEAVKRAAQRGLRLRESEGFWVDWASLFLEWGASGVEARALSKKKGLKALTEFNWES